MTSRRAVAGGGVQQLTSASSESTQTATLMAEKALGGYLSACCPLGQKTLRLEASREPTYKTCFWGSITPAKSSLGLNLVCPEPEVLGK